MVKIDWKRESATLIPAEGNSKHQSQSQDFTGLHLLSNLLQPWQWKHGGSILILAPAAAYYRLSFICSPVVPRFVLEQKYAFTAETENKKSCSPPSTAPQQSRQMMVKQGKSSVWLKMSSTGVHRCLFRQPLRFHTMTCAYGFYCVLNCQNIMGLFSDVH